MFSMRISFLFYFFRLLFFLWPPRLSKGALKFYGNGQACLSILLTFDKIVRTDVMHQFEANTLVYNSMSLKLHATVSTASCNVHNYFQ